MRWLFSMSLMALACSPQLLSGEDRDGPLAAAASHPAEVALVDEGARGSVYRQTANSLRLYTYDLDGIGRSACNGGCASAWPPLLAPADARPVGEWMIVARSDGRQQWAYRGQPVYMRFHDAPDQPTGDGIDGKWHLIPYTKTQ